MIFSSVMPFGAADAVGGADGVGAADETGGAAAAQARTHPQSARGGETEECFTDGDRIFDVDETGYCPCSLDTPCSIPADYAQRDSDLAYRSAAGGVDSAATATATAAGSAL